MLVLGDQSRENGLKHSLLERLCNTYKEIGSVAAPYSLTLTVNHRCNNEILEIPQKLFYSNNIKANPHVVPSHPNAKYPLIFVCSSLSEHWDSEVQNIEANLLLDEAYKYVSPRNWPKKWGKYCDEDFAILASTQTQVKEVSTFIFITCA